MSYHVLMAIARRSYAARTNDNRLLSAPFEFAVSLLFIVTSISFVKSLLALPAAYPHVGILVLPMWLLWFVAFSVGTGGALIVLGLVVGPYLRFGRGMENAGLWLAGSGWLVVWIADCVSEPSHFGSWAVYLCICIGVGLRLFALHRLEHAVAVAASVVNKTDVDDDGNEQR